MCRVEDDYGLIDLRKIKVHKNNLFIVVNTKCEYILI